MILLFSSSYIIECYKGNKRGVEVKGAGGRGGSGGAGRAGGGGAKVGEGAVIGAMGSLAKGFVGLGQIDVSRRIYLHHTAMSKNSSKKNAIF